MQENITSLLQQTPPGKLNLSKSMTEKIDPYFKQRLATAKNHRVIKSLEIKLAHDIEVESNKELPNPVLEGTIEEFGWSDKSVKNIIDAVESGKIKVTFLDADRIRIEFYPIHNLPEQLGHISELKMAKQNLKNGMFFGSQKPDQFTYLQTIDFAVEGYMDDEQNGKEYARVFVHSPEILNTRNVYLDPESLHITDYEYGYSYCVIRRCSFGSQKI